MLYIYIYIMCRITNVVKLKISLLYGTLYRYLLTKKVLFYWEEYYVYIIYRQIVYVVGRDS